jgi:hypothetical protein
VSLQAATIAQSTRKKRAMIIGLLGSKWAIEMGATMKAALVVLALALQVPSARANYGYCFTRGLLGGTKVFIHNAVHEADFWDSATVNAYRAELENSHRLRFASLSCPGFDSEAEAKEHLASTRRLYLEGGFAEFTYPVR